jgi:DnaJ-class molecular chaperone
MNDHGEPETLLKFHRFIDGRQATLRWTSDTHEGRTYISARIWRMGRRAEEYPTRNGITIRVSELVDVIAMLQAELAKVCSTCGGKGKAFQERKRKIDTCTECSGSGRKPA